MHFLYIAALARFIIQVTWAKQSRKQFILDPSFQSMSVEARLLEKHSKDCIHGPSFFLSHNRTLNFRQDKEGVYEELPLFELEKIYCTEEQRKWLKEKIVDCRILS